MEFNKFDICEAYYLFGMEYHSGQGSKEYAYMGRADKCGFKPGASLSYESLSENGKAIYDSLKERIPSRQSGRATSATHRPTASSK